MVHPLPFASLRRLRSLPILASLREVLLSYVLYLFSLVIPPFRTMIFRFIEVVAPFSMLIRPPLFFPRCFASSSPPVRGCSMSASISASLHSPFFSEVKLDKIANGCCTICFPTPSTYFWLAFFLPVPISLMIRRKPGQRGLLLRFLQTFRTPQYNVFDPFFDDYVPFFFLVPPPSLLLFCPRPSFV